MKKIEIKDMTKEEAVQVLKENLDMISELADPYKRDSFRAKTNEVLPYQRVGYALERLMNSAIDDNKKPPRFTEPICKKLLLDYDWLLARLDSVAGDLKTGEKMKALLKERCLKHGF